MQSSSEKLSRNHCASKGEIVRQGAGLWSVQSVTRWQRRLLATRALDWPVWKAPRVGLPLLMRRSIVAVNKPPLQRPPAEARGKTVGSNGMSGSAPADRNTPSPATRSARLPVAVLRRAVPVRMWGGKGCGAPCDFCRVVVSDTDVEYEIEADLDGQSINLHFHTRCHDAWKAGREPPVETTVEPEEPAKTG